MPAPVRALPGVLTLIGVCAALVGARPALPAPGRLVQPARAADRDSLRRIDANRVNMFVTNLGRFAADGGTGNGGLLWPRGSSQSAVYASGLWLGGKVNGQVRVTVADYSTEYGPGAIVGGSPEAQYAWHHVYKVVPWRGSASDTALVMRSAAELTADPTLDPVAHHGWTEYATRAASYGAPMRMWRLPNTDTPQAGDSIDVRGPDVIGDQMLWAVYNDGDAARHANVAGSSPPLGVEVQQTMFAFAQSENLRNTVFVRFRIIDSGTNTIDSLFVSLWADPDLGGAADDYVGCDTTRALGFCYNASASDNVYGVPPPAVGYTLLRGPVDRVSGDTLGMTAFSEFVGGNEPASAVESYRVMRGLSRDGSARVNPATGIAGRFFAPGDPVRGTGWLDANPADRKMMISSGPFRMAPGDTQDVWAAITVGRGPDHLASVGAVRCQTDLARLLFRSGFGPLAGIEASPCSTLAGFVTTNCPRSSDFWRSECVFGGVLLTSGQLDAIAACVNDASTLFDWPPGSERAQFCAVMDPPRATDAGHIAKREFAAMLANECAGRLGLMTTAGEPIWLNPLTNVSCTTTRARTVGELSAAANLTPEFVDALYLDNRTQNPRALSGVPVGLPAFQGGAGPASGFPGSALDPVAQRDSFSTVEIRFDRASTQSAYRYLRLERQSDGTAPPQGRAYLYGGFRRVPFTCWDLAGGTQLDAAFVERALTDDAGTLLASSLQPATFDSTWGPDASTTGGHEYLIVFRRAVSRTTPRPSFAVDGFPLSAGSPALYTLASRLRNPASVIDDGDAFRFQWGLPRSPGADSLLIGLESQPPDDPAVYSAYTSLIACLEPINHGLGAVCGGTIASAITVQSVDVHPTYVIVTWLSLQSPLSVSVERNFDDVMLPVAQIPTGPDGLLIYRDDNVTAGGHYVYQLAVDVGGRTEYFGLARADVPGESRFAFLGAAPNPATQNLLLVFSLATRDPARLELLDIAGRIILSRELVGLGPGRHVMNLGDSGRFRAGIYLVRIVQGGRHTSGKVAIVH